MPAKEHGSQQPGPDYHVHEGETVLAMALSSILRVAPGTPRAHKMVLWCPVCGFKLTEAGVALQLEVLERVYGKKKRGK